MNLACVFFGHEWRRRGVGLPGSATEGEPYSKCLRCDEDSRPTWQIEDEAHVRAERLDVYLIATKPGKDVTAETLQGRERRA